MSNRVGRVEGKVILVTGGAGGFGRVMAERLLSEGATVVLADRDAAALQEQARLLGCIAMAQDVTDEADWERVIETVEARCGRLDVLVNNAGIEGRTDQVSPEDTTLEDFRRVLSVNVEGVFLGCRAAIPAMRRAGGGSIVNMSSIAALLATPFQTAYGVSKAAVKQLTMSVAAHVAPENIRCNAVHPGQMRTRMIDSIYAGAAQRFGLESAQAAEAQFTAMIPMRRLGTASDVAYAVLYLASDESAYVTGTSLVIDGGMDAV